MMIQTRHLAEIAFLGFVFLLFSTSAVNAACTSPAGAEGVAIYNDDQNVLQYCNGTSWKGVAAGVSGSGGCINPSRYEGNVIYNADQNVPQLCSGAMWIALGKLNPSATSGGCSSPAKDEGSIIYNDDYNVMQYCDGSTWRLLQGSGSSPTAGCTTIGQVCSDGTVYAGLSGASTPMYATRCDAGQTWNGSACTGTRLTRCWNNCNTTGLTLTSQSGSTDGRTYTANLITIDSDSITSGTQQHVAAQYCADLSQDGHSDWYLPATIELVTMYTNKTAIGNFNTGGTGYWSSTEQILQYSYFIEFASGSSINTAKESSRYVRCVRR